MTPHTGGQSSPDDSLLSLGEDLRSSLKDPTERRNPVLESIEEMLPGVFGRVVAVLSGAPLFETAGYFEIEYDRDEIASEVQIGESRLRALILDTTLTPAQNQRVARAGQILTTSDALLRSVDHFLRYELIATGKRERAWAEACLTPAAHANLKLAVALILRGGGASYETAAVGPALAETRRVQARAARAFDATVLLSPTTSRACGAVLHALSAQIDYLIAMETAWPR